MRRLALPPALAGALVFLAALAVVEALLPWLDGLWQLWDKPLRQCLHDKAADTVVVKTGA